MTIAHVLLSLDPGGLERVVLSLVREGLRLGQRVSVICLERPGTLAGDVEAMGVFVHCLAKPPGLTLGMIGRLRRLLEQLRPDVVHTHQIGALFYAGPAAHWAGIPAVVHTEHGKHYSRQRSRWLGRLSAIAARQFFCVSSDIGTTVVEYGIASRKKVSVVPNGINVAAFADRSAREPIRHTLGIAMDAPVVGTVGRLSEIKSQDLLIRAFAQLHLPNADPHLLVVGDGAQREPLTTLARDLGLDKRIHFAGYQPDPAPFLAAMDIFALTSRSEGMPLAVLEAWAAGLPVVASRVGGMPELIEDGHTGVLFDYPDQGALVSHLQRLLCDRVRAERIGRAGQQLVRERFDVSIMAETYHRHYVELLSQAAPVCCPGV